MSQHTATAMYANTATATQMGVKMIIWGVLMIQSTFYIFPTASWAVFSEQGEGSILQSLTVN